MPGDDSSRVASPGPDRTFKGKIFLALGLCCVLPVILVVYVGAHHALAAPGAPGPSGALLFVLMIMGVALVVGGYVIWDLGRSVARLAREAALGGDVATLDRRRDEVSTLMVSFNKMLTTIEQQAAEINSFAGRLDSAYKELESTNARLKEFSFRDEVTGLYNRRFFGIRLEEEISRYRRFNHPVSVVMMDLDGFKAVNDTLGHGVGDETLREVAQILLKHSRGINVVSRYGGDEFAVLLVETSKAGATLYGDRIRQVIAGFAFSHGQPITASLGIASLPDDEASTSEDLVRAADEALYTAKRAGKNQVALAVAPEKATWSSERS